MLIALPPSSPCARLQIRLSLPRASPRHAARSRAHRVRTHTHAQHRRGQDTRDDGVEGGRRGRATANQTHGGGSQRRSSRSSSPDLAVSLCALSSSSVRSVDNSEWTRNGDYAPTRFSAQCEAVSYLANAKLQENQESSVGLMTMAGARIQVLISPGREPGQLRQNDTTKQQAKQRQERGRTGERTESAQR